MGRDKEGILFYLLPIDGMGRGKEDILFGFLSLDEMGREMEGILFETSCMLRFAEHSPRQSD
jgi:hypothetical protein